MTGSDQPGPPATVAPKPPAAQATLLAKILAIGLKWLAPTAVVIAAVLMVLGIIAAVSGYDALAETGAAEAVLVTLGEMAAMTALSLLMIQLVLVCRVHALDRLVGLDRLYRIHRLTGATAAMLACLHPLLIYAGVGAPFGRSGVLPLGQFHQWHGWPEIFGIIALTILLIIACISIWRTFLELSYRVWYRLHVLVYVVTAAAIVHAFLRGADFENFWVLLVWSILAGGYGTLLIWSRILRPANLRRRKFTVQEVTPLSDTVCRLELAAPDGRGIRHEAGQFAFFKFESRDVSGEEHPFTISSAPYIDGTLVLTIKNSGDWTATVAQAQVGDRVIVDGPYGRFSHRIGVEDDEQLLMIAGGVGITPMLAMLEDLATEQPQRSVLLIWANRTEKDIFARAELEGLLAKMPNLGVHHVLSRQEHWPGPTGHVDAALVKQWVESGQCAATDRVFLCGPEEMMESTTEALLRYGFARRRIHTERFAL